MDYESPISKVEAQLEMNQKEFERLHQAINELRRLMLEKFDHYDLRIGKLRQHIDFSTGELRKHTDLSVGELRVHTDLSISELRAHTDLSVNELRKHFDQQLETVRRDASINMCWMMGMWLTTIGLIVGLGGRVFGIY